MVPQLSQPQRVRALSLIEAGWSQARVARHLNVSRWTIGRLQKLNVEDPSKVRKRKVGTGLNNKSYGAKEVRAILRLLEKNSFLTSFQVKMRLKRTLRHLSARTIRRIMVNDLGRPAAVASKKPYLTEEKKVLRMTWCKSMLRKPRRFWQDVMFVDEVMFSTKASTGGRLVRRPKGASRSDPRSVRCIHRYKVCDRRYTRKEWKRGQKLMALCGLTGGGERFIHFLHPGIKMNARRYSEAIKKSALKSLKRSNLTILHDRARVHTAKHTQRFLADKQVKSILLPPTSPDLQPIENIFGYLKQLLQRRPTTTLKQLKAEVRRAWRALSEEHLQHLAASMRRRMRDTLARNGEMTDY